MKAEVLFLDGNKIELNMTEEEYRLMLHNVGNGNMFVVGSSYVINKKEIKYINVIENTVAKNSTVKSKGKEIK